MKPKLSLGMVLPAISLAMFGRREECHNAKAPAAKARESMVNAIRAIDAHEFDPKATWGFEHDRIEIANASLFDSAYLSEPLTQYSVGWKDDSGIDEALAFFAPEVPVGMRFEYRAWNNADEFATDVDDARAIGGGFKEIDETGTIVQDKLLNRGLQICVDEDQVDGDPNWRERVTGRLLRRVKRNALIRAVTLLDTAGDSYNTAVTWDTTAGKDPDQDLEDMLAAGADSSGLLPTRIGMGETARLKRKKALRAQTHAGGFAGAGLTAAEIAAQVGVDEVFFARSRYGTGATKTRLIANKVLAFMATAGMDTDDPANIKRFYRLLEGQRYRVYEWKDGPKRYRIALEHYERIRIPTLLGIRKLTVS